MQPTLGWGMTDRVRFACVVALQVTWGLPQTLLGLAVRVASGWPQAMRYRGALVVTWPHRSGLSLGLFVFVPAGCKRNIVVHEYGHCLQSLILGPLYLPVVGVPSLAWAQVPACGRRWREGRVSYYSFWPERWANALGERVTGERAPR